MTDPRWVPGRDYTFTPGKAERNEVDTDHLKNVIPILEHLRDYIRNRLTGQIDDLSKSDALGKDPTVAFGKFPSARKAASLHRRYRSSLKHDYENVATSLDTAIGATKEIIHNYDTTEERNHANAAAVSKAFVDAGSGSGQGTHDRATDGSQADGGGY